MVVRRCRYDFLGANIVALDVCQTGKDSAMSSISSTGTNPNDPYYTLLQQLNGQNAAGSSAASNSASVDALDPPTDDATASAASAEAHEGRRRHGLSGQIESAVSGALQSAAPGTNPNQTIQNAIEKALKNGVEQGATQTGATATATPQSTFAQTLQSAGVDPQQFQQDLQAALQNSNGTSSSGFDFATLFRSFPPGSAVNTLG
jgi:hypothetical protein